MSAAASCGWVRARSGEDAVALLHRADPQMYETKRERKTASDPAASRREMTQRLARARARILGEASRSTTAVSEQELRLARSQVPRRR